MKIIKKLFALIMAILVLTGTFAVSPRTVSAEDNYAPEDVTVSLVEGNLYVTSENTQWIADMSFQTDESLISFVDSETYRTAGYVEMNYGARFETANEGKTFIVPAAQISNTIYDGTYVIYLSVENYEGISISNNTIELSRGLSKMLHIILHANGGVFDNQDDPQEFDIIRGQSLYDAHWDDGSIELWPTREGYCFVGWFDQNDNRVDMFQDSIASDMELYAHWSSLSVSYDEGLYIYSDNEEWLELAAQEDYGNSYGFGLYGEDGYYEYHNTYAYNIIEKEDGYLFISEKNLINYKRLQNFSFNEVELHTGDGTWYVDFPKIKIDGVKDVPTDVALHQDDDGNLIISSNDKDYLRALTDPCTLDYYSRITSIGTRIAIADPYTTSSDARNRMAFENGFIINSENQQPIIYDEEKEAVIISYETLVDNYLVSDSYRFYIDASGYQGTMVRIDLEMPECTVTFDPNNGEELYTETVIRGDTTYPMSTPVKEGYVFAGWYLDGKPFDFSTPIMNDIVLTAKWNTLTVRYDGGFYIYSDDDEWLDLVATSIDYKYKYGIQLSDNSYSAFYHNSETYHILQKGEGYLFISEKNLINFNPFQNYSFDGIVMYTGFDNFDDPFRFEEVHFDGVKDLPMDVTLHQDDGNLIISSDDKDYLRALTDPCVLDDEGRITSIGTVIMARDSQMTSSDARRMKSGDPGFFINTADSQMIVYDEEKGVVIISYDTLISNQLGGDDYRFTIRASGYMSTYPTVTLNLPERCRVVFDPNNGEVAVRRSVWKGDPIEKPETPVNEGYVFIGWYLEDELFDFTTPITEDITLTAGWISGDVENGNNTIPDYTDEDKQEVADSVENTSIDLTEAVNSIIDTLITEDVLEAMGSEEVQALGENVRLVIETSLSLEITDLTTDDFGVITGFIVDIVPQYRLKASDPSGMETVTLNEWTALPEIKEMVTVKLYVPESVAALGDLWVRHKGQVIGNEHEVKHDHNGWYIEFENDQGFSPFEISVNPFEEESDYVRIFRESRLEESIQVAEELRKTLGLDHFSSAIIAKDSDFADALSGSYLAAVKEAPILLVNDSNHEKAYEYLYNNLPSGSTVYILGGDNAVSSSFDAGLSGAYEVKRLAGSSRYMTNLEILNEAGMTSTGDIFIVTGSGYADSLSSAAVGLPIMMVDKALKNSQKKFLQANVKGRIYILGETASVSADIEKAVKAYGPVTRIGGSSRWKTTKMVADQFFANPEYVILATGNDFADGLIASPLAYALNSPLLMVHNGKTSEAKKYVIANDVSKAYIIGTKDFISDDTARTILQIDESVVIVEK